MKKKPSDSENNFVVFGAWACCWMLKDVQQMRWRSWWPKCGQHQSGSTAKPDCQPTSSLSLGRYHTHSQNLDGAEWHLDPDCLMLTLNRTPIYELPQCEQCAACDLRMVQDWAFTGRWWEWHVLFLLCLSFPGLPPKEEAEIMERAMTWAVDFTLSFTRVICIVCGMQLNPPDLQVSGHTQPYWHWWKRARWPGRSLREAVRQESAAVGCSTCAWRPSPSCFKHILLPNFKWTRWCQSRSCWSC